MTWTAIAANGTPTGCSSYIKTTQYAAVNAGIGPLTYQNTTQRHSEALAIPYEPQTTGLPLETFTLSSLVQRRGHEELAVLQRLEFELLIWCRSGSGRHQVDFDDLDLVPGRIIHIRPGQIHRWTLDPLYGAQLFLIRAIHDRSDWSAGAHVIDTDTELDRDLEQIVSLTDLSYRSAPLSLRSLDAIRDLLIALLGLSRPAHRHETHLDTIYQDFERLLGERTPPPRTVKHCAQLIGCSTRTLTRACQSAASAEAKVLIDRAVALEAQRQLSEHRSATHVAAALGFAELSHFTRFFKRVTGSTPSAFAADFSNDGRSQQSNRN